MRCVLRILAAVACMAMLAGCATGVALPGPSAQAALGAGEPPGIVGLAAQDLRTAYGVPAFVRQDGGDEMWRYDGGGCKAFFFLYPDSGRLSVHHVETLPRGTRWAADPACLNALRAAASPPVS
ncbi:MAG: hypothetical protein KGL26_01970 [Pseudomonadota bacterium]|nr:hypothetical protein [Pseudomonadota bacterium]